MLQRCFCCCSRCCYFVHFITDWFHSPELVESFILLVSHWPLTIIFQAFSTTIQQNHQLTITYPRYHSWINRWLPLINGCFLSNSWISNNHSLTHNQQLDLSPTAALAAEPRSRLFRTRRFLRADRPELVVKKWWPFQGDSPVMLKLICIDGKLMFSWWCLRMLRMVGDG